jgi:membrane protein YdbS with pleckstrin-like domain
LRRSGQTITRDLRDEEFWHVMDIDPQDLIAGERIVWRAHIHQIHLVWPSFLATLLGSIAIFLFYSALSTQGSVGGTGILTVGALLFLVAALLVAAIAFVNWHSRRVTLTEKRLRVVSGVLGERVTSILLSTIESGDVQQGILGRILGFGTVILRDRKGTVYRLKKTAQPTEFLRQLQELLGPETE